MFSLETQRLQLHPFKDQDIKLINELHSDPEVTKLVGFPKPPSIQDNQDWLNKTLDAYEVDGLGQLAIYLKETGEFIGRGGLRVVEIEKYPKEDLTKWFWYRGSAPKNIEVMHSTEIGYTFSAQHWGKGYATEAVRALCQYAFTQNIDKTIVAVTFPENIASIRVLEKSGFAKTGEIDGLDFEFLSFELKKEEIA